MADSQDADVTGDDEIRNGLAMLLSLQARASEALDRMEERMDRVEACVEARRRNEVSPGGLGLVAPQT